MMDSKYCLGCSEDFYNGKNPLGVEKCWMLRTAKLIRRVRVHINEWPPWRHEAQWLPTCYCESQYVFVLPDNPSCQEPKEDAHAGTQATT